MEDKLLFFKQQDLQLWSEFKNSNDMQRLLTPFTFRDISGNSNSRSIELPRNICKIYVTLVGGGGSGSLGEHRRLGNALEDGGTDTGHMNVLPLPGSGGGGGATVFRFPMVFVPKRKNIVEYRVGKGGEGREIVSGSRQFVEDSLEEKQFRLGRSGEDSRVIIRQYDPVSQNLIKEIKLKAMGGGGGGIVGYLLSRSDIFRNFNSQQLKYFWGWSYVKGSDGLDDAEGNEFRYIDNSIIPESKRHQYWTQHLLDPKLYPGDSSGNKSQHFNVAAEHYTAITKHNAYVAITFHQEAYYPIQDPRWRNDYVTYNLMTHGVDGILAYDWYKPDSIINYPDENTRKIFGQGIGGWGDYQFEFPKDTRPGYEEEELNMFYQYRPNMGTSDIVSISKSNLYKSFGIPRYYIRTGEKYYFKDRSVAFRRDLTLPFDSDATKEIFLTSDEYSIKLIRWSEKFRYLVEEKNGPFMDVDPANLRPGTTGAFGGAGGGFILYDDATPDTLHGLAGGLQIASRFGIPASGFGGNPFPRKIINSIDEQEFRRNAAYQNALFYYGGEGYGSANSIGGRSLFSTHFVPGSGGGALDYLNIENYVSDRTFKGEVDYKESDPEFTEGRILLSNNMISNWHIQNYEKLATGGTIDIISQDPQASISKIYINKNIFGRHTISTRSTDDPSGQEIEKAGLLKIYGGGGGGGKAFRYKPGDGQDTIFMEPEPAGIGCGSGGSASLNEDGKSVVRGAPVGTVNWYLNRMLNDPNECYKYMLGGYKIYVYSIFTIIGYIVAGIIASIIIDVLTAGAAAAVGAALKTTSAIAKAGLRAVTVAIKNTNTGLQILNVINRISQFVGRSSAKAASKVLSKIKLFIKTVFAKISNYLANTKIGKLFAKFKNSKIFFSKKTTVELLENGEFLTKITKVNRFKSGFTRLNLLRKTIASSKAWKVFSAIAGVVLFNDWAFIGAKFQKPFKAASKIADITSQIDSIRKAGDNLDKIPKLQRKVSKLQKSVGKFGDLAKLKKTNRFQYELYKWFNQGDLFIEPAAEKLVASIDNKFRNYFETSLEVTAKRQKEITQIAKSRVYTLQSLIATDSELARRFVADNIMNADFKKFLKTAGEKAEYSKILKKSIGDELLQQLDLSQTLDSIVETAELIGKGSYQPRINVLLRRLEAKDITKLTTNEKRELLFNIVRKNIGDKANNSVQVLPDEIPDVVEAISRGPLTNKEKGSLLSELFTNNRENFLKAADETNINQRYFGIGKIYEAVDGDTVTIEKIRRKSPELFLYLNGYEAKLASVPVGSTKFNIRAFQKVFNLQEYLVKNPKVLDRLSVTEFDWNLFPEFNSAPSVSYTDSAKSVVREITSNKKLLRKFISEPSLINDSNKFGKLFNGSPELLLKEASKDPDLADIIIKNFKEYKIDFRNTKKKTAKLIDFKPFNGDTQRFITVEIDPDFSVWKIPVNGGPRQPLSANGTLGSFGDVDNFLDVKVVNGKSYVFPQPDNNIDGFFNLHNDPIKFSQDTIFTETGDFLEIRIPNFEGNPDTFIYVRKEDAFLGFDENRLPIYGQPANNVTLVDQVDDVFLEIQQNLKNHLTVKRETLFFENGKVIFNGKILDNETVRSLAITLNYSKGDNVDAVFPRGVANQLGGVPEGNLINSKRIKDRSIAFLQYREASDWTIFMNQNNNYLANQFAFFTLYQDVGNAGRLGTLLNMDVTKLSKATKGWFDNPSLKNFDLVDYVKSSLHTDNVKNTFTSKQLNDRFTQLGREKVALSVSEARLLTKIYRNDVPPVNFFKFVDDEFIPYSKIPANLTTTPVGITDFDLLLQTRINARIEFLNQLVRNEQYFDPNLFWKSVFDNIDYIEGNVDLFTKLRSVMNDFDFAYAKRVLEFGDDVDDAVGFSYILSETQKRLSELERIKSQLTPQEYAERLNDLLEVKGYINKYVGTVSPDYYKVVPVPEGEIAERARDLHPDMIQFFKDNETPFFNEDNITMERLEDALNIQKPLTYGEYNNASRSLSDMVEMTDEIDIVSERYGSIDEVLNSNNADAEKFKTIYAEYIFFNPDEGAELRTFSNLKSRVTTRINSNRQSVAKLSVDIRMLSNIENIYLVNLPFKSLNDPSVLVNSLKFENIYAKKLELFNKYKDEFAKLHKRFFEFSPLSPPDVDNLIFDSIFNAKGLNARKITFPSSAKLEQFLDTYKLSPKNRIKLIYADNSLSDFEKVSQVNKIVNENLLVTKSKYQCFV